MKRESRASFERRLEEEKLAALAEFAAGAGHEINNPLAVISGRAQLLARDEPHPERRRDLATIHAQAKRVHEMIADMMLFARPPAPALAEFDLAEALAILTDELRELAAARDIKLDVQAAPSLLVVADSDQLLASLRAMVDNAVEAMGRCGRIEIGYRRDVDSIRIHVRDEGPGISAEVRRHLFDPFYSGRQAGRGLGMGLAKAWRLISGHGGRIDVESTPEEGTTFSITLPINPASRLQ